MNLTIILEVQSENRKGIIISAVSIKIVKLFEFCSDLETGRRGDWATGRMGDWAICDLAMGRTETWRLGEVRGAGCEGARCEGAICDLGTWRLEDWVRFEVDNLIIQQFKNYVTNR